MNGANAAIAEGELANPGVIAAKLEVKVLIDRQGKQGVNAGNTAGIAVGRIAVVDRTITTVFPPKPTEGYVLFADEKETEKVDVTKRQATDFSAFPKCLRTLIEAQAEMWDT